MLKIHNSSLLNPLDKTNLAVDDDEKLGIISIVICVWIKAKTVEFETDETDKTNE
jgi:hypothetical protein